MCSKLLTGWRRRGNFTFTLQIIWFFSFHVNRGHLCLRRWFVVAFYSALPLCRGSLLVGTLGTVPPSAIAASAPLALFRTENKNGMFQSCSHEQFCLAFSVTAAQKLPLHSQARKLHDDILTLLLYREKYCRSMKTWDGWDYTCRSDTDIV